MFKRVKFFLCAFLVLLVSCNKGKAINADSNNDSIKKYLDLASNDTLTFDQRNQYNKKAFSLIDLTRNDTVIRYYLSENSLNNIKLQNWDELKKISKKYFEKSVEANDTLNLARCYRYKGYYYKNNAELFDSAFYYFNKAEKLYRRTNDLNGLGCVFLYKGQVLNCINDFSGAELEYEKAKKIFKKTNNESKLIAVLISTGINYNVMFERKNAIKSYAEALEKVRKSNIEEVKMHEVYLLSGLGSVYYSKGDVKRALYYYEKAQKYPKLEEKNIGMFSSNYSNIACCKMDLNQNDSLPTLFFKSLNLSKKINNISTSFYTLLDLSNFYLKKKDTINAQKYADEALVMGRKSQKPYNILNGLKQVGIVNKEKAAQSIIEYDVRIDSLLNNERRERSKFLKIQLETNEIQQEKEQAIKQKWIIVGSAAVIFLIGLLLFIITKQRSKQKELLLLQSQQKANEEIYQLMLAQKTTEETARQTEKKRIALELHDGIMNKLASTRLNLFVLSKKTDKATIEKCLTYISEIYTIEQEIRSIAHDLNQDVFKEANSFFSLIKDFIIEQNNTSKAKYVVELQQEINWVAISSEIKMNLYRIIQEASHNINKYSKAKNVVVSIIKDGNMICMSISDDGVGFDTKSVSEGIGIQNMQQRVQSLNGKININSIQKNSTCINISIPI